MSEYTPTTEQVREAFSEMSGWDMSAAEADTAFDRWLAAHDAEKDATIAELRLELAKQEDSLALARFDTEELHRIRSAGVVDEEPEWEYLIRRPNGSEFVSSYSEVGPGSRVVSKRQKCPWVPVEN